VTTLRQWTVRTRELGTGLASTASQSQFYLLIPAVGTLVDVAPPPVDLASASVPTGGLIADGAPSATELIEAEVPQSGVVVDAAQPARDHLQGALPVQGEVIDDLVKARDAMVARVGILPSPAAPPTSLSGNRSFRDGKSRASDHLFDSKSFTHRDPRS